MERLQCEIRRTSLQELRRGEGMLKSQFIGAAGSPPLSAPHAARIYTAWHQFINIEKPVGLGHIVLAVRSSDRQIEITGLGVASCARRRGIGTRLIQEALWLTTRERPRVSCQVPFFERPTAAEALLGRCGFQAVGLLCGPRGNFRCWEWLLIGEAPEAERLSPEERRTLQWP